MAGSFFSSVTFYGSLELYTENIRVYNSIDSSTTFQRYSYIRELNEGISCHHKIIRVSKRWWENRLKRPLDTGTGTTWLGYFDWLRCDVTGTGSLALNGLWKSTPRMNWIPQKYRQGSWLSNNSTTVASPRQVVSLLNLYCICLWNSDSDHREKHVNIIHAGCSFHSVEWLSTIWLSLQCNISWQGWIKSQLRLISRSKPWYPRTIDSGYALLC